MTKQEEIWNKAPCSPLSLAWILPSIIVTCAPLSTHEKAKKYFSGIPNYPNCPIQDITDKSVVLRSVLAEANDLVWKMLTQMFRLPKAKETVLR